MAEREEAYVLCKCCREGRYKAVAVSLLVLGLAAIGVAMFLPPYIDSTLHSALQQQVTITREDFEQNTDKYVMWSDPTSADAVALYYHVTLFNCTNPAEVVNGSKPVLQEVGPYVYRDMKHYFNVSFGTDAQLRNYAKYHIYEYFLFQRDMTDAALDPAVDRVYSVNMAYQALVPRGVPIAKIVYDFTSDHYKLWGNGPHTINEVLFGYFDTQFAELNKLQPKQVPPLFPGAVGNDTSLEEAMADPMGTHPAYTIYTGETPHEQLLRTYAAWQDQTYLFSSFLPDDGKPPVRPTWLTPDAQRVAGTDGTQFRQAVQKGMALEVFVDELYRSAPLVNAPATDDFYVESLEVKGITMYRFTMPPTVTLNATSMPANAAYSMFGPDGMANLTTPKSMNLFMSKPHWMDGDPRLLENVTGVSAPVRTLHDTYVDVEPLTGSVMHAAKRLQGNVLLAPTWNGLDAWWLKDVQQLYMPLFWAEQSGEIPDHLANEFVGSVYMAQNLSLYLRWIGFFGGAFFTLVAFAMIFTVSAHFPPTANGNINASYGAADAGKAAPIMSGADVAAQAPYDPLDDDDGRHGDRPIPADT